MEITLSRYFYLQSNTPSLPRCATRKIVPKCVVRNQFYLYKDAVPTECGTRGTGTCKLSHLLVQMQNGHLGAHLRPCRAISHCTQTSPRLTCSFLSLATNFSSVLPFKTPEDSEKGYWDQGKKKTSMFLMSFSLVYCSFCKSSLRIASCQISSPKIHIGASNAPRTHFNMTGSNRVRKCQRVSRSQSLLQHTWLALQLSEISVFTGAGKKRFLSFESTALVPERTGFKVLLVLLSSSEP